MEPEARDAFAELWPQMYRFFLRRSLPPEDAKDLAQESLLRLWRRRHAVPPQRHAAYAYRIAQRLLVDHLRRRPRVVSIEAASNVPSQPTEDRLHALYLLSRLPESQSMVIELRLLEGYSVEVVAGMLHRTPASVKNLQYRGLQALRTMLQGEYAE